MTWTHDGLAADLMDARHLAGEIALERLAFGAQLERELQLDVASMRLSWTTPRTTGYEVKISRADFLHDIRDGKWRRYLAVVERLFFAVPKGLVDEHELPAQCGLLVRGTRSWWTARRAPQRILPAEARARFVTALLFRHYAASWDGGARARVRVADAVAGPCAACSHTQSEHKYGRCEGARECTCHEFLSATQVLA